MKSHILRLVEHHTTGLKYLSYHYGTQESNEKYVGSGSYWLRHLSKHGYDVNIETIYTTNNRDNVVIEGLKLSKLWDIVNSSEFANLTIEDIGTTAEPLHRPGVKKKRNEALKNRICKFGQTVKEKARTKKAVAAMQDPEVRARAAKTLNDRRARGEFTEKELRAGESRKMRIATEGFTEAELACHKRISERQVGKTMKDRCGDDYVDPRKGKKRLAPNSTKGRTAKEIHGDDWIDPRSKQFSINSEIFESERDCIIKTGLSGPIITKLKKEGTYTVNRLKNSKHIYENGQLLTLKFI